MNTSRVPQSLHYEVWTSRVPGEPCLNLECSSWDYNPSQYCRTRAKSIILQNRTIMAYTITSRHAMSPEPIDLDFKDRK